MKRSIWNLALISLLSLVFIVGCAKQDPTYEPTEQKATDYTPLSNKGIEQQHPANEAKQLLSQYEEVSAVNAVHYDDELIVAIQIEQEDRFSLDHLEKEFQKKLKKSFPKLKIDLSTDQKLLFELDKLETKLANDSISKKDLKKKMKSVRKLMKEET